MDRLPLFESSRSMIKFNGIKDQLDRLSLIEYRLRLLANIGTPHTDQHKSFLLAIQSHTGSSDVKVLDVSYEDARINIETKHSIKFNLELEGCDDSTLVDIPSSLELTATGLFKPITTEVTMESGELVDGKYLQVELYIKHLTF